MKRLDIFRILVNGNRTTNIPMLFVLPLFQFIKLGKARLIDEQSHGNNKQSGYEKVVEDMVRARISFQFQFY